MTSLYDMLYEIDNKFEDVHFEKIEGHSLVGSPMSNAQHHPIQYIATSNIIPGYDEPFEGIGWTPTQAVRNLLKILRLDISIRRT